MVGLESGGGAPLCRFILPRMLGSLVGSILPTSQVITLVTGSNEYFPCVGVKVILRTDLGNGISRSTPSTCKQEKDQHNSYQNVFILPLIL